MNIHRCNITDMARGTGPWVAAASPLRSVPEVVALLPKVEAAHNAVITAERAMQGISPELREVLEKLAERDAVWDQLLRAADLGFAMGEQWALAQEPPDQKRAAEIAAARQRVLPDGLRVLNASYGNEAAFSERTEHLFKSDSGLKNLVSTLAVTKDVDVGQALDKACAVGTQMRELDRKRLALGGDESTAQPGASVMSYREARNLWLKVVSTVLNMLELSDADPKVIAEIRRPIEEVAEMASKRAPVGKKKTPVKG